MERRAGMVAGMGVQNLMDLLTGGRDEEHKRIITQISEFTAKALESIPGVEGNKLARLYVQNVWSDVIEAFKEAEIAADTPKLTTILRIMADAYDLREKLHKELHDRRENQMKSETIIKPVDKDLN